MTPDDLAATVRRDASGRRLCSLPDCDATHRSRGMCATHYMRFLRTGNPAPAELTERSCSVDGCDRVHHCRGWCQMHYQRWTRHRDPIRLDRSKPGPRRPRPAAFDLDRLARIDPQPGWQRNGACYRTGATDRFFPSRGERPAGRELCNRCPARYACLAAALAVPEREDQGIWGGTSAKTRRAIRRALASRSAA